MLDNFSYIKYPKYNDYPSNLLTGFQSNIQKNVNGKKVLIILDITGSMGSHINSSESSTKLTFAKKVIKKIIDKYPFTVFEIMPFNTEPLPIISFDQIPEPNGSTYFSPILPEVLKLLDKNTSVDYSSVILMSDGLPSEDTELAHNSISALGTHCREVGANTISVAIGSEADGNACSLFTGNRGYNCFVKFEKDIDPAVSDIINGIKCNYVQVRDGVWIPIDESGNYYFLGTPDNNDNLGTELQPTYETTRKYISLIIQNELFNPSTMNISNLVEFIKTIVNCLPDEKDRKELIEFYTKTLVAVENTSKIYMKTPSINSAVKQVFQTYSSQFTGI